jgi:hypothetical protein
MSDNNVVQGHFPNVNTLKIAEEIMNVIDKYKESLNVFQVIGILEMLKIQIIDFNVEEV